MSAWSVRHWGVMSPRVARPAVERPLACVVGCVPVVDLPLMMQSNMSARIRGMEYMQVFAEHSRMLHRTVSPLSVVPATPVTRRFLVAGTADRIVDPDEQVWRLWEHWDRPNIQWANTGHSAHFRNAAVSRAIENALRMSGLARPQTARADMPELPTSRNPATCREPGVQRAMRAVGTRRVAMTRPASRRPMEPFDTLMYRTEDDPRIRSSMMSAFILDRAPDWDRLRYAFERITREVVALRQRVVEPMVPITAAQWVVDPDFDLNYHLRRVRVPGAGTERDLLDVMEPILMMPLDRARPLWEVTLVSGLKGRRAALVFKMNHAITDGAGWPAVGDGRNRHRTRTTPSPGHAVGSRPRRCLALRPDSRGRGTQPCDSRHDPREGGSHDARRRQSGDPKSRPSPQRHRALPTLIGARRCGAVARRTSSPLPSAAVACDVAWKRWKSTWRRCGQGARRPAAH